MLPWFKTYFQCQLSNIKVKELKGLLPPTPPPTPYLPFKNFEHNQIPSSDLMKINNNLHVLFCQNRENQIQFENWETIDLTL